MTVGDMYALRREIRELASLKDAIVALETRRTSPKIAAYGADVVRGSRNADINLTNIAKIDALIERYNASIAAILAAQAEFETAIDPLLPLERVILRQYFLDGLSWEAICIAQGKSYRQIMRIWQHARDVISGQN